MTYESLEQFEAMVDAWADQEPCPSCERLQDMCLRCESDFGAIFGEGLRLVGFVRLNLDRSAAADDREQEDKA